jgi:hypothetical protein
VLVLAKDGRRRPDLELEIKLELKLFDGKGRADLRGTTSRCLVTDWRANIQYYTHSQGVTV